MKVLPVSMQTVLGKLATFIDQCRDDGLPDDVSRQGGRLVLDTVGCMVAGASAEPARPILESFAEWATDSSSSDVLGTSLRLSAPDAAYVNAYTADVLDLEETLVSHPSAVVLAAGLAVGQQVRASGRAVLTAVMTGYEVGSRLGSALTPSPEQRREVASEFWWKPVAASVTAGMLLGVRGGMWADVIGYATAASPASRRGGFDYRPLSDLKANYGGQAQVGVLAAHLGLRGFHTYRAMLDGERTYAQLLGSDRWEPEALLDGLGDSWVSRDIGFKRYAACLYLHTLLEAAELIRADARFSADKVESIEAQVPGLVAHEMNVPHPGSTIDAQFSASFTVAALLRRHSYGAGWITNDTLHDKKVLALARKVRLIPDAKLTRLHAEGHGIQARLRITLDSGVVLDQAVDTVLGSSSRPLSTEELVRKFVASTSGWLDGTNAEKAAACLLSTAEAPLIDEVVGAVRQSS